MCPANILLPDPTESNSLSGKKQTPIHLSQPVLLIARHSYNYKEEKKEEKRRKKKSEMFVYSMLKSVPVRSVSRLHLGDKIILLSGVMPKLIELKLTTEGA
jgi:hypothetical protein